MRRRQAGRAGGNAGAWGGGAGRGWCRGSIPAGPERNKMTHYGRGAKICWTALKPGASSFWRSPLHLRALRRALIRAWAATVAKLGEAGDVNWPFAGREDVWEQDQRSNEFAGCSVVASMGNSSGDPLKSKPGLTWHPWAGSLAARTTRGWNNWTATRLTYLETWHWPMNGFPIPIQHSTE